VPTVLVELVEKALAKDPAARFVDAGALRDAVHRTRHAMAAGRLDSMTLAEVMEVELIDEAELAPGAAQTPDSESTLRMEATRFPTTTPKLSTSPPRPTEATAARRSRAPGSGPPKGGPPKGGPSTTGFRTRRPGRPAAPTRSKLPYLVGGVAVVAVLGALGFYLTKRAEGPTPGAASVEEKVGALTQALVRTQLSYAQRVLEDKDYDDAIRQAEEVLTLDPDNEQAREILRSARRTMAELDAAAGEARAAFDADDMRSASDALSRVMALDPEHPIAVELTAKLNEFFQAEASEARNAMARSRRGAESAGAGGRKDFGQALALAHSAEAMLERGEFAEATQGLLQSRDAFDRARRAAEAEAEERAEAARKAAAEEQARGRADAAPSPPPTPQRKAVAAAEPSPPPPPAEASPELAPAIVPARGFVASSTSIRGARVEEGRLAGFDTSGVQKPPEFEGEIEFEVTPPEVRPGDAYTIEVFLSNTGKKTVKLERVEAETVVDGARETLPVELAARESHAGKRELITEVAGVLGDATRWALVIEVTSQTGETYRSRLKLR
jgi:hypothetical protein